MCVCVSEYMRTCVCARACVFGGEGGGGVRLCVCARVERCLGSGGLGNLRGGVSLHVLRGGRTGTGRRGEGGWGVSSTGCRERTRGAAGASPNFSATAARRRDGRSSAPRLRTVGAPRRTGWRPCICYGVPTIASAAAGLWTGGSGGGPAANVSRGAEAGDYAVNDLLHRRRRRRRRRGEC